LSESPHELADYFEKLELLTYLDLVQRARFGFFSLEFSRILVSDFKLHDMRHI